MKGKIMIGLIVVLLAVVGFVYFSPNWTQPGAIDMTGCTWQPDYYYASCVIDPNSPTNNYRNNPPIFQCSPGADTAYCEVVQYTKVYGIDDPHVYQTCQQGFLGLWSCTGDLGLANNGKRIERGQWVFPISNFDIYIKSVKQILMRCGTSGCTGGGEPIVGAQGCSWNPGIEGFKWEDGSTGARSIPLGTGYRYVYSQHLVSCPSTCTDPMQCTVPSSVKSFTMTYGGTLHKAYWSNGLTNVIGCKTTSVCIQKSLDGTCLKYDSSIDGKPIAECGTIATLDGGQCAQNSDCGSVGTYCCEFDEVLEKGTCKPCSTTEPECAYDYDCTQTGSACHLTYNGYELVGGKCQSGKCSYTRTPVGCCPGQGCPSGYFCNSDYACQVSQQEKPDCPYECCDVGDDPADEYFKPKFCPTAEPYCCVNNLCAINAAACGSGPQLCNNNGVCESWVGETTANCGDCGEGFKLDWNILWIPLLAALVGAIGYKFGGKVGALIGAIIGGIIGYAIYWFMSLPWWAQLLIGIGGVAGSAIIIYAMLFCGGLVTLAVVYSAVKND